MAYKFPYDMPSVFRGFKANLQEDAVDELNGLLDLGVDEKEAIEKIVKKLQGSVLTVKVPQKPTPVAQPIQKATTPSNTVLAALLGPNALPPDPSRSLVKAEFDKDSRLVLTFSDGKMIKTKPIEQNVTIEQHVGISYNSGGTLPSDTVVRIVASDYEVLVTDDIVIATNGAKITLPDAINVNKTFRVKRVSVTDVTIDTVLSQTIDGNDSIILNTNYSAMDFHSDGTNWIIL